MSVASQSTQEPEHAAPPQDEEGRPDQPTAQNASRGEFLITLICDVAAPVVLYYVFRGVGFNELFSLLLSGTPPLINTLYGIIKHKKVDTIGVFVILIVVLSAAVSVISGDARAILIRGAILTGLIALWMLSTVWLARPFVFHAMEALLPSKREKLNQLWRDDAAFRSVFQRLTVLWGVGMLADAATRLVMAYTLPIDVVPALEGILYVVSWVGLQVVTQIWLKRTGTLVKVFGPDHKSFGRLRRGGKKKATAGADATDPATLRLGTTGAEAAGAEADATEPATLRLGTEPANSGSSRQD